MLPLFFMAVMGLALLAYVVLDGYDLGVGILLPFATDDEKDVMVSSIGPFWDANETWLVLGIGVLLVAFPVAHGIVLSALYLPVAVMLIGLILRGVSFDFRVKARAARKDMWNALFAIGSLMAATAQGWMLGSYLTGFDYGVWSLLFSLGIALTLPTAYAMLGAGWLIMKTGEELQLKAVGWARKVLWPMGAALVGISLATPAGEPDRVRQVVQHAAVHRPAAHSRRVRRRVLRRLPRDRQTQGGRRRLWLGGVREHRADLRAGLPGPGLQPVSLHRDRPAHGLAGRKRHQVAECSSSWVWPSRCRPSSCTRSSCTACSGAGRARSVTDGVSPG